MRTLLVQGCIENGRGIYHGGALYNNMELECIGITNVADSLAAIKKAVFEDRKITMDGLMTAMKANFEGYADLRRYLINNVPKFGNDNDYVDSIRTDISEHIFQWFNHRKTIIGGIFLPGEVIFVTHESMGAAVGATPDGRLAGTVLADSAGSSQGMDKSGPTALMNSVMKIPKDFAMTNLILNMRFMKKYFSGAKESAKLKDLFKSFFAEGGIQVQVNVLDADELRRAEREPEKYASLVVRVGGYSDYYVNLSPCLRAEILARTEYEI